MTAQEPRINPAVSRGGEDSPAPVTARLRAVGLGAIADLGFVGLGDSGPDADPAVITGYKAARDRPLTRRRRACCPRRPWPRTSSWPCSTWRNSD
ncbi:hypothetical protein ACH4HG_41175 [Streptomyces coeruleorubidus]|uniref:Uncharacterized protein n=1 Tax=Streptomyces coeruleorubidus TaxID=116188 RepID=A0ABZ0K3P7_STRC4|nr:MULTISPECIES: hypothetical protein [Streptomyces]WOT32688.1 hypothetical protein R5U08_00280 [Streptomyces coeruleorubidus]